MKLCRLLKALYASTISAVRVDGELTDWFDVNTGLRQGCLLSPALFNVYIDHKKNADRGGERREESIWCRVGNEKKRSPHRVTEET